MNNLIDIGFVSHGVLNLTPNECFSMCKKGAAIVDVREEYMNAFKVFKVEKLFYLSFSQIEQLYEQLPHDIPLIFADAVGLKSREAVIFMSSHGYENVANMVGGIVDWERDGLPLSADISNRLSGSCMCQIRPREWKKNKS